jgi:hypothetical protein
MYQFGPYSPTHATAATFALRREYLKHSRYQDNEALAEERHFLKGYTAPFVQLDPMKTILVFSHIHNSFDKKKLLEDQGAGPYVKESTKTVEEFVKEPEIKNFFINKIDALLDKYEPGRPENKPEVLKQIQEITEKRKKMQEEQQMMQQQQTHQLLPVTPDILKQLKDQGIPPELIEKFKIQGGVPVNGPFAHPPPPPNQNQINHQILQQYESRFTGQQKLIQTLINENIELKENISYLNKKMKELIESKIEERRNVSAAAVASALN